MVRNTLVRARRRRGLLGWAGPLEGIGSAPTHFLAAANIFTVKSSSRMKKKTKQSATYCILSTKKEERFFASSCEKKRGQSN